MSKMFKTSPNTVKSAPEAAAKQGKEIKLMVSEVESDIPLATIRRESKYEFGLDELAENQSRFIAVDGDEDELEVVRAALQNHIVREREARLFLQNFAVRDAEVNGQTGLRVWCKSIKELPMRHRKATQQAA